MQNHTEQLHYRDFRPAHKRITLGDVMDTVARLRTEHPSFDINFSISYR